MDTGKCGSLRVEDEENAMLQIDTNIRKGNFTGLNQHGHYFKMSGAQRAWIFGQDWSRHW
jgi:hypothetical protein